MGGMEVVVIGMVCPYWRMGEMAVAWKNGTNPSILAYGWHGDRDVLIGLSILAYGWHGGRLQKWYKSIQFGVWGGMEVVLF
jgi:hypothetical protein